MVSRPTATGTLSRRLTRRILARPGAYRHPRAWGGAAVVGGLWLLVWGFLMIGVGLWWGAFLLVLAAFELWRAYVLLLAPLPQRVRELERSRAHVVDDAAARLRRIEQDLHDGAQAQMVAVVMKLGLARDHLETAADSGQGQVTRALELVDAAHRGAREAIAELRDLARGIHPPALDEGLDAALAALVDRSDLPVELVVDLPERPSPAIETIAYFCAAELLTNAAKHSSARQARLEAVHAPGLVRVRVSDDGVGGAHVAAGGGLAGLDQRVEAVDGRLHVDSPVGGPTVVTVELPSHA